MLDHMTHLFRLQVIVAEGSLRKASEKLNVTQPALSRSVAHLETHYGKPLLERHARGVKPTPYGERILNVVQRMNRYWAIAQQELDTEWQDANVRLRIGAGPTWQSGALTRILLELQEVFPNVLIEFCAIRDGNVISDLANGRLDVVFGGAFADAATNQNLIIQFLTGIELQIVARESHPAFGRIALGGELPEDIALDYPWVTYSELEILKDTATYALAERLGRPPQIRMTCDRIASTVALVQQSNCLTVLPNLAVSQALSPALVPLPIKLKSATLPLGMLFRKELAEWPPVKFLTQRCVETFDNTN